MQVVYTQTLAVQSIKNGAETGHMEQKWTEDGAETGHNGATTHLAARRAKLARARSIICPWHRPTILDQRSVQIDEGDSCETVCNIMSQI